MPVKLTATRESFAGLSLFIFPKETAFQEMYQNVSSDFISENVSFGAARCSPVSIVMVVYRSARCGQRASISWSMKRSAMLAHDVGVSCCLHAASSIARCCSEPSLEHCMLITSRACRNICLQILMIVCPGLHVTGEGAGVSLINPRL